MKKLLITLSIIFGIFLFSSNINKKKPIEKFEKEVLKEINKYRKTLGLDELKMNKYMQKIARKHSKNMASNKVDFGHDGFYNRIKKIKKALGYGNASAENVAWGAKTSKEVVQDWINSSGHKKNIEGNYNLSGIGIAKNRQGVFYYTHIFLKK